MESRITDAQVAALRAFLLRDSDAMTLHTIALGNEGTVGYQRLMEAALSVAAVRRFAPRFTSADIVRFVASVRASRIADGNEYDFDATAAENVLRYSLGQNVTRTPDPADRFRAVIALLGAFTDSELSSEADLGDLLARARTLADRWAANQRVLARGFFIPAAVLGLSPFVSFSRNVAETVCASPLSTSRGA